MSIPCLYCSRFIDELEKLIAEKQRLMDEPGGPEWQGAALYSAYLFVEAMKRTGVVSNAEPHNNGR